MKRHNAIYAAIMVCSLLAAACQKEYGVVPEGALQLSAEGFNGDKLVVDNTSVAWVEGDTVSINGVTYPITISEGHAYTNAAVEPADNYYAYYPSGLDVRAQQATQQTNTQSYAIYVPNTYSCSYNAGGQVIKLPMVACAGAGSTGLNFKHITSAILVNIKNSTGYDVFLDRVVVKSETQRLNSSIVGVSVPYFQNDAISMSVQTNNEPIDEAEKYVVVTFGNEEVDISDNGTKKVQVPILPISDENDDLTIEVYTHSKLHSVIAGLEGTLNTNYDFIYSKQAAAPALARNEMCEARIEITRQIVNNQPTNTTEVDHSLFEVAENRQVRFSQGNLQFAASQSRTASTDVVGTWRFAEHQYDYVGDATYGNVYVGNQKCNNASISQYYSGWIDLFGWGTSGWDSRPAVTNIIAYQPWSTDYDSRHYWPRGNLSANLAGIDINNPTINYAEADWAYHNAISNGGNDVHQWRTMTALEWEYLIDQTSNGTGPNGTGPGRLNAAFKRGIGKVNGVCGVILLPDSWTLPSGCTFTTSSDDMGNNDYNINQWKAMEAAGAVFLPAAGWREKDNDGNVVIREVGVTGHYWSTTQWSELHARSVIINNSNIEWETVAREWSSRRNGYSVRPVKPVQ